MAVPVKIDAKALGGNFEPERGQRQRLKAAKNILSESIGSGIPKLDSNSRAAVASLGMTCPVPLYLESNHVQSISVKKKAKQQPISEVPQVKKKPKPQAKSPKPAQTVKVSTPDPVSKSMEVAELCYHLANGDIRGAKSYLEYHFDGDKAAEQQWVAANSAELLEACIAYEPTNYSPDGDPDPQGWSEYDTTPVSVDLSTYPIETWKRRGDGLHFTGKKKARLQHMRPKGYDDWLELNTPITRKNGSPVVTWLADKEVCAKQAVTEVEPVLVGNLQVGRSFVRKVVDVPYSVSEDLVVEHVTRRIGGYRAAYGDSYVISDADLAIVQPESKPAVTPMVNHVAANDADPPPWEDPVKAATFYDEVQRQRGINSFNYEGMKWRWFFTEVGKDLRQKRNERINRVFEMSMAEASVVATTTHKPAEDNLQDDVTVVNTGYMDDESVVYVDSEQELDTIQSLCEEFSKLTLWERGEVKVQAENEGTTVNAILQQRKEERRDILHFKQELNRLYRGSAQMALVAAAALEQQRYDTWFRWAAEADTPQHYARNDIERYHEYWDKLECEKPWLYQYACERVAFDKHMSSMELKYPSNSGVGNPHVVRKTTASPVAKAGVRATSESTVPVVTQSRTNLNVPEQSERSEKSIIREIMEAGNTEAPLELRTFIEALKKPVVDLTLVRQHINRFQLNEGGILVPS